MLRALLPHSCTGCGRPGEVLCAACLRAIRSAPAVPAVSPSPVVLGAFAGPLRRAVHALKYRGAVAVARVLVAELVARRGPLLQADAVTWVPAAAGRRRRRGYDQSHLLAGALAARLHVPTVSCLARAPDRGRGPQAGRAAGARCLPAHTFLLSRSPPRGRLLLVDDVVTTGATLRAALAPLLASCADVVPAAVAATPRVKGVRRPRPTP